MDCSKHVFLSMDEVNSEPTDVWHVSDDYGLCSERPSWNNMCQSGTYQIFLMVKPTSKTSSV